MPHVMANVNMPEEFVIIVLSLQNTVQSKLDITSFNEKITLVK